MALAQYGHSTMRQPYGDKIVFIGDAAHSTSPQLGQGANMALLDAWSLVDALRQTNDIDGALRQYAKSRRWHVRAFQFSSLAMTPFYQSDSRVLAGLRDLLFDPVSRLPIARRIVAGLISGMLARPPAGLTYF
jgi:salicylate hydroxylase